MGWQKCSGIWISYLVYFVLHLLQASINTINFSTIKITLKIKKNIQKPLPYQHYRHSFAPSPSRKK